LAKEPGVSQRNLFGYSGFSKTEDYGITSQLEEVLYQFLPTLLKDVEEIQIMN
jgi:hypothetical protein